MARLVRRSGEEVTVEVTVRLGGSLLDMEGAIQEAINAVGRCATEEALKRFDTDGSPIRVGEIKLTARGRDPKECQTPYGPVPVERNVYQGSRGGRIYCPMEDRARIVRGATPLFASQISHKYFTNHCHQMDYPGFLAAGWPIGSGVTEPACKTLVKQRLCASGMRWKNKGAKMVLSLRALTHTTGRWTQFWQKIDQFGAACCG